MRTVFYRRPHSFLTLAFFVKGTIARLLLELNREYFKPYLLSQSVKRAADDHRN